MSAKPKSGGRVVVLDDEERLAQVIAMVLRRAGHSVDTFFAPGDALADLEARPCDVLLSDLKMPGMDGVEVVKRARAIQPDLPVVLITAHGTIDTAVEAMKAGAFDYLEKPVDNERCRRVVAMALAQTKLARENRALRGQLAERWGSAAVVAESAPMQAVLDLARRAAKSRSTALISGESGSGKEVIARFIHVESPRVGKPFIAVNCRAFAAGVLESELFGHAKGAFTGADTGRAGVFERADGGTLFLDEIGDVDEAFQAKLLRVLQEREVQRVGGDRAVPVDVRVLCATNRDLRAEVDAGRFREDLYFRLAVVPIDVPPLRERRDDIVPLARTLVARLNEDQGRRIAGWSDEVEAWLLAHDWPGNVRELFNTLERGVVLARGDVIELTDLLVKPAASAPKTEGTTLQEHLDAATESRIRQALAAHDGVRVEAARELGVERTTLYRLMKRFGIR